MHNLLVYNYNNIVLNIKSTDLKNKIVKKNQCVCIYNRNYKNYSLDRFAATMSTSLELYEKKKPHNDVFFQQF